MKIVRSTKKHKALFKKWRDEGRMEETTCREIKNGKHVVDPTVLSFSFFLDNTKEPVGKFDCFNINKRNRSCEFGYAVDPAKKGRGVGTALVRSGVDHIFNNHEINKVYCQTGAFNTPSIKILMHLGFHRDGVLRQHHELDGKLWDDYVYSILRGEWEKERKKK